MDVRHVVAEGTDDTGVVVGHLGAAGCLARRRLVKHDQAHRRRWAHHHVGAFLRATPCTRARLLNVHDHGSEEGPRALLAGWIRPCGGGTAGARRRHAERAAVRLAQVPECVSAALCCRARNCSTPWPALPPRGRSLTLRPEVPAGRWEALHQAHAVRPAPYCACPLARRWLVEPQGGC